VFSFDFLWISFNSSFLFFFFFFYFELSYSLSEISSCLDIKTCDSSYVDGEYQMRPQFLRGQTVRLYCHGLNTTSPTEFLTLHKRNIAVFNKSKIGTDCQWYQTNQVGIHLYTKVKINITVRLFFQFVLQI